MAVNPILTPLPADLPTNWETGQTVAPNGSDVGLSEQYGYNYQSQQINSAQTAVNTIGEAFTNLYGNSDVVPVVNGGTGSNTPQNALVNLGAASNPNLLDNWYFANPVNQRGKTNYVTDLQDAYTIDRWISRTGTGPNFLELGAEGIQLYAEENVGGNLQLHITQVIPIEQIKFLRGKTVTLSILYKSDMDSQADSAIYLWDYTNDRNALPAGNSAMLPYTNGEWSVATFSGNLRSDCGDTVRFMIRGRTGESGQPINTSPFNFTVKAAKLELGSVQTLAHKDSEDNWVLNDPPPNYQQELSKCQRYFYRLASDSSSTYLFIGQGNSGGGTEAITFPFDFPVSMRVKPTISSAVNVCTVTQNIVQSGESSTGITILGDDLFHKKTSLQVSAGNVVANAQFRVWLNPGSYIDFSADL